MFRFASQGNLPIFRGDYLVASSLIQTLSWKDRNAKKITTAESGVMEDVLLRLIPLIGAESLFEE
ncbi:hypothetical protein [Shewanella holmiensis]|uniref:Uncharacterized protein n=1 Tax=Shewanella holmiensis TaxID=2952222 RepID=A0A9X3AX67_9GAMM|nr:hypothetical protein [Shewanella holmiensis]MCT7942963.1 hypothetical protein [Shewanella holmiensis]